MVNHSFAAGLGVLELGEVDFDIGCLGNNLYSEVQDSEEIITKDI